jgi:hypothetical protein
MIRNSFTENNVNFSTIVLFNPDKTGGVTKVTIFSYINSGVTIPHAMAAA